jgi:hypothetical protein
MEGRGNNKVSPGIYIPVFTKKSYYTESHRGNTEDNREGGGNGNK